MQVGWGISASLQTDKLYDALGSTTFAALAIGTLTYAKYYYARQILATVLVIVWAARLGSFLVFRVLKTGKDSRFDEAKTQPCGFSPPLSRQHTIVFAKLRPLRSQVLSIYCLMLWPFLPRCKQIPSAAVKFWVFWTLQAVWVWVTLLPVMILNGCANNPSAPHSPCFHCTVLE